MFKKFPAAIFLVICFCILQRSAAFANDPGTASPMPGIYELSCAGNSDFVLDVQNCLHSFEISHTLQLYRCLDVNQQKYYLEQLPGGFYRLSNLFTAQALTADKLQDIPQSEEGTAEVFLATLERPADAAPADVAASADAAPADVAAPADAAPADAAPADVAAPADAAPADAAPADVAAPADAAPADAAPAEQSWSLESANDGCFYIRSKENSLYLTLESDTVYNGASVSLKEFTGDKKQKWLLARAWISSQGEADTDLVNNYDEDGKYSNFKMALRFGMDRPVLTAAQIAEWMMENDDHQLVLDQAALTDYVQKLADQYDTQGYPRKFRTSYGKEITLYKGNFGWKLDVEKTVQEIKNHLDRSGTFVIDPIWSHKGVSFTRGDDIGNSYVEVDLINQKVWLYRKGKKILESDCVTGTYGTDRQTPGGVYSIYYLQSPAVLRGPDYVSPVDYWMPFNGGVGLHDANWRSTFGGDIYKTNGSHGCINLPVDIAKQMYQIVEIGYPVVCYN